MRVSTVLGKALVESPPWAHTRGGSFIQPHFLPCIYNKPNQKQNPFQIISQVFKKRYGFCMLVFVVVPDGGVWVGNGKRWEGQQRWRQGLW